MDQSLLVRNGHRLIRALDKTKFPPRFALWFHDFDIDTWLLWVVPRTSKPDKREFYRVVLQVLSRAEPTINLDSSVVRLMAPEHPAIQALMRMSDTFSVRDGEEVTVSHNMLDGFFLEEGILIRLLQDAAQPTAA